MEARCGLLRSAALLLIFLISVVCYVSGDESVVVTLDGPVKGVLFDSYRSFQGIPYAQPPVGSLRWASPLPVTPWAPKTLDASSVGHGCPQRCVLPPHTCPKSINEDCLYLNVYTPRGVSPSAKLPVLFFIPGGRFEQGDGGSTLYTGEYIANKTQSILVTTNYRLGSFGFLATDTFTGNYGIQDQRMSLTWVNKNIGAFGGDATKITIFGQSAGGTSTCVHLVSPLSKGLYSSAIIESNPITLPMKTREEAKSLARIFVSDLNCTWNREDTDDCLRSRSMEDVLAAQYTAQQHIPLLRPVDLFYPWTPVIGSADLPQNPLQAFIDGKYNKVPIIAGTVKEEAWMFIYIAAKFNLSEADYLGVVLYVFGTDMPSVISEYPPPTPFYSGDYRPLLAQMGTPYVFSCSMRAAMRAISKYNAAAKVPTYLYEFSHVLSFDAWGPRYQFCVGHVCHGSELPLVFHSAAPYFNFSAGEEILSEQMIGYWTNFAHSGDPNQGPSKAILSWPTYQTSSSWQNMKFDIPSSIETDYQDSECNFWDSIGYDHGV